MDRNTGKQWVQEGKHRNAMLEHRTGTGTRIRTGTGTGTKIRTGTGTGTKIRTGTGTGTKPETVILRTVLVIPKFECRTKFWESWELV